MTIRIVSDREITLQMQIEVLGRALQKALNERNALQVQLANKQMMQFCMNCGQTDATVMGHATQAACAVCCGPTTPNTKWIPIVKDTSELRHNDTTPTKVS